MLLLGTIVSTSLADFALGQKSQLVAANRGLRSTQTDLNRRLKQLEQQNTEIRRLNEELNRQTKAAEAGRREADDARQAEAELRKNADDKRRAIEQQSKEIIGLNDQLRRSMEDQRRAIYAAEMNLVRLEAQRGNLPRLRELLMQQIPGADEEDLRGWEWTYWYRFLHQADVVYQYAGFVYGRPDSAMAIAPGGKLAALTRGDKTEWIEVSSGKVIGTVSVRLRLGVNRNSLSAGGRLVDAADDSPAAYFPPIDQLIRPTEFAVWEPGGEKHTFPFPKGSLLNLSFVHLSEDGTRVAAIGNDAAHQREQPACRLLVWDVAKGDLLLNQVEPRELNRLQLSQNGQRLAAWLCHGTKSNSDEPREVAAVFDVATGQILGVARHNDDVDGAFLLTDGDQLLLFTLGFSGSNRKDLLLWKIGSDTPQKLTPEMMPDFVKSAASPDGRLFAVSGHTVPTVRVFEIDGGRLMATLNNETTRIESLTFAHPSAPIQWQL